jgi:hypothetical protein
MNTDAVVKNREAGVFQFSRDVPINIPRTLDQLLATFAQPADGLPELIKNSKDQYLRLGIDRRADRQIVVLIDTKSKRLGVLDFAGASAKDFAHWRIWSEEPDARQAKGHQVEAGHGNGGKAFMARGASKLATMESCANGRYTSVGYQNDDEAVRYLPGFSIEKGRPLDNVAEPNPRSRLDQFLAKFGVTFGSLPAEVKAAFTSRGAFTGILLDQVSAWSKARVDGMANRVSQLAEQIADHGQTALSLETCEVWMIADGSPVHGGPIKIAELDPYPGFEHPIEIQIPDILTDPLTKEGVAMGMASHGPGSLRLETTKKNLSLSPDLKARNVIRLWNAHNNVANWFLPALGLAMPAVYFIRGRIDCPALAGEHLQGADRVHLADTPLTRALENWTAEQVKELATKIQRAQAAETAPHEQDRARKVLKALRDLMRGFLDPDASGEQSDEGGGDRNGKEGSGSRKERVKRPFGSRVDRIVLERAISGLAICAGTNVPLVFSCLEDSPDELPKMVKGQSVVAKCDPSDIAAITPDSVEGLSPGVAVVWLETPDGLVKSNEILVEVLDASSVDIIGPPEPLKQGERSKLAVSFKTPAGSRDDLMIEASVDEPDMGSIGRGGIFTAGGREGLATVRVRYGAAVSEQSTVQITIGPDRVPPRGLGGDSGSDIPEILLCGEELAGMEELPPDQRTHPGGPDYTTIIEEPQFPNVVWLNPRSAESTRVRKSMGSPKGIGGIGNKTFAQFMALKCFEVLKRLHVRQQLKGMAVTETQFLQAAAEAEMGCANFIDAAWEASETIFKKVDLA